MSVSEVADELALSERRVRALVESGRLRAERFGGSWLVPKHAVEVLRSAERLVGRPLSAANCWALLALLAGEKPEWVQPDVLSRLRRHAREKDRLPAVIHNSEPRADVLRLWLPREDASKLDEYPLVRSGLSAEQAASQLNVIRRREEPLDAYVHEDIAHAIVRRFVPEEDVDDPNVILRVPCLEWVFRDHESEVPLPVVAADLLDHEDARVRRAAEDALRELAVAR